MDKDVQGHLPGSGAPSCAAERIQILLAEYTAREQEKNIVAQGLLGRLQVAFAVLVGLIGAAQVEGFAALWLAVPVSIVVFAMIESDRQFSVLYQSMYIGILEERVNQIAEAPLLQWARLGSSFHNVLGKWQLKNDKADAHRFNWGNVVFWAYIVIAAIAFALGLWQAQAWIQSNNAWSVSPWIAFSFYLLPQLFIIGAVAMRVARQRDDIDLLRDDLRARLAPELPPTGGTPQAS
jgi:hypothetical protein